MVTISRKLAKCLEYKTVFFPTRSALHSRLSPTQISTFFWSDVQLEDKRYLVRQENTATICIDLDPALDTLLKGIAKNTRYEIRQAEKLGNRVRTSRNGAEQTKAFLALFNDFARSKPEVRTINENKLNHYQGHSDTFLVHLDDKLVCGHVLLYDTQLRRTRLLYSASRRFDDCEAARLSGTLNRYLHWYEIQTYKEEKCEIYDMGGISTGVNAGIDQFKKLFGGRIVNEYTYLCSGLPYLSRMFLKLLRKD